MLGFEVGEELPRWPNLPPLHIVEALTDPFDRAHHGAFGFPELFHKLAGSASKRCQRLML